jgi:peptidoglycan/LPS O-acetylase OafA/YrhL
VVAASPTAGRHTSRFEELDSLRGLAALVVMVDHLSTPFPPIAATLFGARSAPARFMQLPFMHLFFAGSQAVLLFFVLSGFVLALPFVSGRHQSTLGFIIKRVCRIYLPYLAVIAIAILLRLWVAHGKLKPLGTWFNWTWTSPVTMATLWQHAILIDSFNSRAIDPPIWSLVFEMRISLLFPALVVFCITWRWRRSIAIWFGVACVAFATNYILSHHWHLHTDYILTFTYVYMFAIGAVLARHREAVCAWYGKAPTIVRALWLPLAIVLFTYPWLLANHRLLHVWFWDDAVATAGSAMFIVSALASPRIRAGLRTAVLVYVGRISYSLYLIHFIVFEALMRLLYGTTPSVLIVLLTVVVTLIASSALYYVVERPSISLGRSLDGWIRSRQQIGAPLAVERADSPA